MLSIQGLPIGRNAEVILHRLAAFLGLYLPIYSLYLYWFINNIFLHLKMYLAILFINLDILLFSLYILFVFI